MRYLPRLHVAEGKQASSTVALPVTNPPPAIQDQLAPGPRNLPLTGNVGNIYNNWALTWPGIANIL